MFPCATVCLCMYLLAINTEIKLLIARERIDIPKHDAPP